MKKVIAGFFAAAFALHSVQSYGADAAETKADQLIERATAAMAEARELEMASDIRTTTFRLDGSEPVAVLDVARMVYRAPGTLWSQSMTSNGMTSVLSSDGSVQRSFSIDYSGNNPEGGEISERPLVKGDYMAVGTRRFDVLSPLLWVARSIQLDGWRKVYTGQQKIRGELCDTIEAQKSLPAEYWARTRKRYPRAPEAGISKATLYLRASDGWLLRVVKSEWSAVKESGEWPEYLNARQEQQVDYRYDAQAPDGDFEIGTFSAAVSGAMGGKPPRTKINDEWQGKPLPAFDLVTLEGKPVKWEDFGGRILVLETWFINCGYCKYAFPFYEKMRRRLESQGVVFATFNVSDAGGGDSEAEVKKWVQKHQSEFNFVWLRANESREDISRKLASTAAPNFFIVGADGKVVASYGGFGYGNGGEDPRLIEALGKAGVKL